MIVTKYINDFQKIMNALESMYEWFWLNLWMILLKPVNDCRQIYEWSLILLWMIIGQTLVVFSHCFLATFMNDFWLKLWMIVPKMYEWFWLKLIVYYNCGRNSELNVNYKSVTQSHSQSVSSSSSSCFSWADFHVVYHDGYFLCDGWTMATVTFSFFFMCIL